jgi:hypothetical protein
MSLVESYHAQTHWVWSLGTRLDGMIIYNLYASVIADFNCMPDCACSKISTVFPRYIPLATVMPHMIGVDSGSYHRDPVTLLFARHGDESFAVLLLLVPFPGPMPCFPQC